VLVIYAVSVSSILKVFLGGLWGQEPEQIIKNNKPLKAQEYTIRTPIIWLVLFILISSIIQLRELLIPPLIKEQPKEQLCQKMNSSYAFLSSGTNLNEFTANCLVKDTQVMNDFAFFPRFF
jgi:hypothetical protein